MSQRFVFRTFPFFPNVNVALLVLPVLMLASGGRASSQSAGSTGNQELRTLELNQSVERELTVGQTHRFRLELKAGQFVKLEVEQLGIDVVVEFSGPDGMSAPTTDREPWGHGKETILWEAAVSGPCRVEVLAPHSTTRTGRYAIRWSELPEPSERERALVKADRLYVQAKGLLESGNHKEGVPLAEQALAMREALFPGDHLAIAESLRQLMYMLELREDYSDVERRLKLSDRILQIRERVLGQDHPEVARWLHDMALASDLAQGPRLFQRALEILEKSYGPDHPDVGYLLSNYANQLYAKGDHQGAEAMYLRAIAIREKSVGPQDSNLAQSLSNLGDLYTARGDYDRAEQFLQRALVIWTKVHGTWHERTSHAIGNLADLYRQKRDFPRAEKLMRQALEIRQKVLSPTTLLTGQFHHGLAVIYLEMGDYARAEQSLQQADAIFNAYQVWTAEYVSLSLHTHVRLSLAMGRKTEALAFLQRAVPFSESKLKTVLAVGSEQDKLNFLNEFAEETNQALSLHTGYMPNDPQALQLAFNTWLQRKGRALDEMNHSIGLLRRFAGKQAEVLFDQLTAKQRLLSHLASADTDAQDANEARAKIQQLMKEIAELQSTISERSAEFRAQVLPPVMLEDVRKALPPGSALVEFAQYQPEDARTKQKLPPRYLAYVLPKEGEIRWAELGEISKIDAAVQSLRQAIGDGNSRTDPRPAARKLDELVMRPIRPLLGQARTVFISPDGELNLAPFAALRDERGRYLIEDYLFIYLTSGRDLLRLQVKHESQPEKLIFAISDFDAQAVASTAAKPSPVVSDTRGGLLSADATMATIRFNRMDYAIAEGKAVQKVFPQAKLFADGQALETALKQVRRPYFLHLVTHGFFLPDGDQKSENPLLRSGLAFAGANQRRSGEDDGLLTAFEAAALDLWGTKLVVLSACETGVGAIKNGEGVFGLRRALVLAGAETQVASLWLADDLATRKLMESFYGKLHAGMGRAEALRQAQLEMLRKRANSEPYFWANFICIGDWRPLEQ